MYKRVQKINMSNYTGCCLHAGGKGGWGAAPAQVVQQVWGWRLMTNCLLNERNELQVGCAAPHPVLGSAVGSNAAVSKLCWELGAPGECGWDLGFLLYWGGHLGA